MNLLTLLFLVLAVVLLITGFCLIYPPLALIAGGILSGGLAVLFWEVE